ncbi:hypothetical protein [Aquimarina algiphila]|uniref:Uncharacterized protein n=1 Tax=Aquimarina algiphila TaxID=2047982 RepID=A0A554VRP7_9FLAO|nr:hypothetical protein [Aquimarina algiphila]TSE11316.1 hypothetical protein FOF46_01415 [Aquimarina algiphila]
MTRKEQIEKYFNDPVIKNYQTQLKNLFLHSPKTLVLKDNEEIYHYPEETHKKASELWRLTLKHTANNYPEIKPDRDGEIHNK